MVVYGNALAPANAPGVDEVADGELPRQRVLQPLGVHHQVVVQEAGVGVERSHLLGAGLHHVWVTVAHWGGAARRNMPQIIEHGKATPTKYQPV